MIDMSFGAEAILKRLSQEPAEKWVCVVLGPIMTLTAVNNQPLKLRTARAMTGYALSVLSVAVVALVLNHWAWLFERGAFAMMLGCVFLSTWVGGWRAGAVAIILSTLLTLWLSQPNSSLAVDQLQDWIRLGIFIVVSGLIAGLHASRAAAVESSRVSMDRLQAALDAARMGAWDRNLRDGSFWWSRGMEGLFGRKPGAFVPTYEEFLGYIHPEDRGFLANAVTRSVEQGTEFEIEHRIVRPDGDVRWIITRGQILHDEQGRAERLLGVAVDVTERHAEKAADTELGHADAEVLVAMRGRL